MAFKFWPFQAVSYEEARQAFVEYRSVLLVAPCGSGKGSIIAAALAGALERSNRTLTLAHRRDLLIGPNALEERLVRQMNVNPQRIGHIISGRKHTYRPVMLGTVQTVVSRKPEHFDLLIVDEAHRIRTDSYIRVLKALLSVNPNLKVMGFTATPKRFDGKSLGKIFQKIIQVSSHGELVEQRFLVPTRVKEPMTPDLKGVRVRMGDFVESDLEAVYNEEVLKSIVDKWEHFAKDRKTVCFTINSKKQAEALTAIYQLRGYSTKCITSDTSIKERQRLLHAFANNEFQVLVNVNIITEGVSIDDVNCIVLAFATQSETKYIQAFSRGARVLWNADYTDWRRLNGKYFKEDCLGIDFGGNRKRFGMLEEYGSLGFDIKDQDKAKNPNAVAPKKTCHDCFEVVAASTRVCPYCGYNFPITTDDDLRLATEVDWEDVDKNYSFFQTFGSKSYKEIWNGLRARKTPEMLLPIAAVRNNRISWAINSAVDLEYVPAGMTAEAIYKYLKKKTRDAGYWNTYQNLMGARMRGEKIFEDGNIYV